VSPFESRVGLAPARGFFFPPPGRLTGTTRVAHLCPRRRRRPPQGRAIARRAAPSPGGRTSVARGFSLWKPWPPLKPARRAHERCQRLQPLETLAPSQARPQGARALPEASASGNPGPSQARPEGARALPEASASGTPGPLSNPPGGRTSVARGFSLWNPWPPLKPARRAHEWRPPSALRAEGNELASVPVTEQPAFALRAEDLRPPSGGR